MVVAAAAALSLAGTPSLSVADSDIAGAWTGGGSVAFATGTREKARCRATYVKSGATSYTISAICATASGKVVQTASIKRTGPSTYAGSFYNADYDTSGSIQVAVRGNSQNVTLTSPLANASLRLSR
ncbi:MAG: hypothetical protein ACT4N2_08810 [Hyphomicrobium sp.]